MLLKGFILRVVRLPKLNAFADKKLNVDKMVLYFLYRVQNILVTSIFSFSHNIFNPFPNDKF